MKTVFKGFSFGLLLQIAVGPLCIYIIKTALSSGFMAAFSGVLAVTLADAIFVALALLGIGGLVSSDRAKAVMRVLGGAVILLFGLAIFLSGFGVSLIPAFSADVGQSGASVFVTALVLTLSSPLTIVFWAGVFGTRLAEDDGSLLGTVLFGAGAVLSTLVSLTLVAAVAGLFARAMTPMAVRVLNWLAGLVLIGFGLKMLLQNKQKKD